MAGEDRWDPDIEWDASEAVFPDLNGVYRGKEAVRQWWGEWLSAWETVEFEYTLVDAGDRVVALIDKRMRGRSTGIEVPLGKYAHLATFRDGLLVHLKIYRKPVRSPRSRRPAGVDECRKRQSQQLRSHRT